MMHAEANTQPDLIEDEWPLTRIEREMSILAAR